MPDIRIHRDHALGLARARKIAWAWAEEVERRFDMDCTVVEGDAGDTVEFTRSGVSGTLTVRADHFDLHARLGFLLGAFSKTIEAEISKNLDQLLSQSAAPPPAPRAAATKAPAARKTVAAKAPTARKSAAAKAPPARKAAAKAARKRSG